MRNGIDNGNIDRIATQKNDEFSYNTHIHKITVDFSGSIWCSVVSFGKNHWNSIFCEFATFQEHVILKEYLSNEGSKGDENAF